MITILLAIDGIAALIILAILSIVFIALSAVDEPSTGWASSILFVAIVLAILFTNIGPMLLEHPMTPILYAIGYIVIGMIFSIFIRWPIYLKGLLNKLTTAKADFLKRNKVETINPSNKNLFESWVDIVHDFGYQSGLSVASDGKITPPQYYNNKARLAVWAILWPWNALWLIVRKPTVWIFDELLSLEVFRHICQAMSDWMFKDFK
jgi:hypothetical protein